MRIIGAEPAGDAVREVTGPVEEGHPDLPHWNDVPTGQVPAILDRSNGEDQLVAPPTWREEDQDWEAQEDVFEPSMLSDDLPAVGALLGEQRREADVRQPWHFESDDTLVIPPEPGYESDLEPEPEPDLEPETVLAPPPEPTRRRVSRPRHEPEHAREPEPIVWPEDAPADEPAKSEYEPAGVSPQVASAETAAASAVAASRLSPPEPPEPKARACSSRGRPLNAPGAFIHPCHPIVAKQPPSMQSKSHAQSGASAQIQARLSRPAVIVTCFVHGSSPQKALPCAQIELSKIASFGEM